MTDRHVQEAASSSVASLLSSALQPRQTASSANVGTDFTVSDSTGSSSTGPAASASAEPSQISTATLSALTQLQAAAGFDSNAKTDKTTGLNGQDDQDDQDPSPETSAGSSLDPAKSQSLSQSQYAMQMSQLLQQGLSL